MAATINLKHATTKAAGQRVFAVADWNADHQITNDLNLGIYNITANNLSGTNTGDQDLSGYVVGPASATDDNVAFFNGATGKIIKDNGLTLSGSNTGDQDLSGYVPYIGATADVDIGAHAYRFTNFYMKRGSFPLRYPQFITSDTAMLFVADRRTAILGAVGAVGLGFYVTGGGGPSSTLGIDTEPWGTLYINTIDLGTNTITDGSMTGDWDVVGDLTAGTIQADNGFTGTGAYTNFTIVGGIITAAS